MTWSSCLPAFCLLSGYNVIRHLLILPPFPPRWTVVLQSDNQNVAKSDTDSQYMIMKRASGGPK